MAGVLRPVLAPEFGRRVFPELCARNFDREARVLLQTGASPIPAIPPEPARLPITPAAVAAYLQAVGDELPIYSETGLTPPLLLAAATLGLLESAIPAGSIHTIQEVDARRAVRQGETLRATVNAERLRERGGRQFATFHCALSSPADTDGQPPALTSKTTIMLSSAAPGMPPNPAPAHRRPLSADDAAGRETDKESGGGLEDGLPIISRRITQPQLNAYAAASGDHNPLHLDAEFAAATQFGGIIAHGMLTLAFLSEMLTAAWGERWLSAARLRVRFKGAAYLGDRVETRGQPNQSVGYAVSVINAASGETLITGTAALDGPAATDGSP